MMINDIWIGEYIVFPFNRMFTFFISGNKLLFFDLYHRLSAKLICFFQAAQDLKRMEHQ